MSLINRQYVGARYVPKIMGEWNKALQYEALSVVTYMGNSFTSKVPVPANVEIDNTDYWVNTGNYNAQVEEYRKEALAAKQLANNTNTDLQTFKANQTNTNKDINNKISLTTSALNKLKMMCLMVILLVLLQLPKVVEDFIQLMKLFPLQRDIAVEITELQF